MHKKNNDVYNMKVGMCICVPSWCLCMAKSLAIPALYTNQGKKKNMKGVFHSSMEYNNKKGVKKKHNWMPVF